MTVNSLSAIPALAFKDLEPSGSLGAMPEFVMLPKAWLHIDQQYQRGLQGPRSKALIRKIVEEFSWPKFTPITAVPLDWTAGKFAVVDGQHRAAAAILHPLVTEVPAWVVESLETRGQAKVFVGINEDRNRMTGMQLFKAQLAAGEPDALQVNSVCERAGIRVAFHLSGNAKNLPPLTTMAVSTIRKLIGTFGEKPVVLAMTALATAYHDTPNQLRGQVIQALTMLFAEDGAGVDMGRLVKALEERDCEDLIDAARAFKKLYGGSTEAGMVSAIRKDYERALSDDRRSRSQGRAA